MSDHEIFIDVRTEEEWNEGHLDGAVHFEMVRLQKGELPEISKDAAIAVYCHAGHRARSAIEILRENGFLNIRNAGGFNGLKAKKNT